MSLRSHATNIFQRIIYLFADLMAVCSSKCDPQELDVQQPAENGTRPPADEATPAAVVYRAHLRPRQ
jgi:hypothetical protein